VTATIGDPAVLPVVVRRLDDAGVVVTELALRNASLNEVFLSLTGRPADETADAAEAADATKTEGSRA
jgi:oleandomycin transport system ATP-binding protein